MKKTYISSDLHIKGVNGLNNIKEKGNFFSTVLINIPDYININDEDFIWYEDFTGEQIDMDQESNTNTKYYSSSNDKFNNHRLTIEANQTSGQLSRNTIWNIEINIKQLLFNYIYAKIKQNRTFDKLDKNKLDIEYTSLIEKFINLNILDKFKFEQLDLYLMYVDIKNGVKHKNTWNKNIDKINIYTKYSILSNNDLLKIQFNQEDSSLYLFDYYYSVKFKRI